MTALLAKKYDIIFADGKCVEGDLMDQFTAAPGTLRLVFKERKGGLCRTGEEGNAKF